MGGGSGGSPDGLYGTGALLHATCLPMYAQDEVRTLALRTAVAHCAQGLWQGIGAAVKLLPSDPPPQVVVAAHTALGATVKLCSQQAAQLQVATEQPNGSLALAERLAEGPASVARNALLEYLEVRHAGCLTDVAKPSGNGKSHAGVRRRCRQFVLATGALPEC